MSRAPVTPAQRAAVDALYAPETAMIDFIYAWGSERGVAWSEPAREGAA